MRTCYFGYENNDCCCCWVLRHFLTSQAIIVASDIEHEKFDKFCSEALISAWGSFTYRKSTTLDPRLYFPSEGSHTQDFYALKNPSTPAGIEPSNLGSRGEYDNHWTTGVDENDDVNAMNNTIQGQFSDTYKTYKSIDTIMNMDEIVNYPIYVFNSLDFPGVPQLVLLLKIGARIIILRNTNPPPMCNGTRLAVKKKRCLKSSKRQFWTANQKEKIFSFHAFL